MLNWQWYCTTEIQFFVTNMVVTAKRGLTQRNTVLQTKHSSSNWGRAQGFWRENVHMYQNVHVLGLISPSSTCWFAGCSERSLLGWDPSSSGLTGSSSFYPTWVTASSLPSLLMPPSSSLPALSLPALSLLPPLCCILSCRCFCRHLHHCRRLRHWRLLLTASLAFWEDDRLADELVGGDLVACFDNLDAKAEGEDTFRSAIALYESSGWAVEWDALTSWCVGWKGEGARCTCRCTVFWRV